MNITKGMSMQIDLKALNKYRTAWHFLFWLVVLLFYTLFFGYQGEQYFRTFLFVVPLLLVTIATTYFVNYFLFPRYLFTGKHKQLLIYSAFTVVISVWLESLVIIGMIVLFVYYERIVLDITAINFLFMVVGMYFIIFIAVGIKLLKVYYENQNALQRIANEKLEAELKLLKAQIHPHFLFNTLNNIYALSLKKSHSAPEMILKLSEILDYLLYECNVPEVPLEKEITLIQNYIALEKIRYSNRLNLSFNIEGNTDSLKIAPLVLLPFVENSFKHGAAIKRNEVAIRIHLKVKDKTLIFTVENSKENTATENTHGGIGLSNAINRLDLIYKNKYRLDKLDAGDQYRIKLKIITQ